MADFKKLLKAEYLLHWVDSLNKEAIKISSEGKQFSPEFLENLQKCKSKADEAFNKAFE